MVYFSKFKTILVLAITLLGIALALPNFYSAKLADEMPDWLPHKQVNLGLDLRGGAHLLLEVDWSEVVTERLDAVVDTIRESLRGNKVLYTGIGVQGQSAVVTIKDPAQMEHAIQLVKDADDGINVVQQGNQLRATYNEKTLKEIRDNTVRQTIEIARVRIDETGTKEPTIQRQGDDRVLIQVPGIGNPEELKSLLLTTAKMTFHLFHPAAETFRPGDRVPAGAILVPARERTPGQPVPEYLLRKRAAVGGESLVNAQPSTDSRTGQVVVNFRFDNRGARKFADITKANVGKPFAIVLDGKVISAPVIREPILGGSGQISGNFTFKSANELALLLRAGALPAKTTIIEERTVGPGLGADSIEAGKIASIVGLVAVIIFMLVVYGLFGVFADLALIANIFLILGSLSLLQATLTLPGIAGIVLTIGMAVDANVLIFERVREEIRAGRTPISAIDAGYGRALTTIVDSNLTTLIAALLLYFFGTGPVRGFAVTLSIGIVTSMFTAIMLTRLMVVAWLRRAKPKALPI